ncbi:hypothetical protein ACIG0D_31495 [Streptomyces sp. NPDC052773]|jgi:hypothetical protein|uniref:hypothetical protein n=1 Tax=Streptomyces sp. NPDC052773 TaxID=3365693 RepID=UPI0037D2AC02
MRFSPTLRFGEVLVVLEGPARVRWKQPTAERANHWTPTGIWPDEGQLAMVREHLENEGPLLVLLDEARDPVPMLREEWQAAPCRLLEDLTGPCPGNLVDDEVVELRLPFLDWLPAAHRDRAARFLADSDTALSRTPLALLPPLMVEKKHDGVPPSPRFARRLVPNALTPGRLTAAIEHLFAAGPQQCTAGSHPGEVIR